MDTGLHGYGWEEDALARGGGRSPSTHFKTIVVINSDQHQAYWFSLSHPSAHQASVSP